MNAGAGRLRRWRAGALLIVALLGASAARAEHALLPTDANFGPYDAIFLQGGIGMSEPLAPDSPVIQASVPWTLSGWVRIDQLPRGQAIVAAIGDPLAPDCRCLVVEAGRLALRVNSRVRVRSPAVLGAGTWHAIAAVYDGAAAHLYLDGRESAAAVAATMAVTPVLRLAPEDLSDLSGARHFGGAVARLLLTPRALDAREIRALSAARPDFSLVHFRAVGVGWPLQERAWRGLQEPQPAWTLPYSEAPVARAAAVVSPASEALTPVEPGTWSIGGWRLEPAPATAATGEDISSPGFHDEHWYPATVPGTVLSTLVANGVYPDPDYGLNNLAIPENLSRQDYWYRTAFMLPADAHGRRLTLTLKGVNYAAEVWLNGAHAGAVRGAFIRGVFDVSALVRPAAINVLAVRVSPPPHPGIPHEQSVLAGPGENGGTLALDGPTFIATEGWDWIPGIRDRNTGLWQDVELSVSGALRLLDPQVTTLLPLPRTDTAFVAIVVPIENPGTRSEQAVLEASFANVRVRKEAVLEPGVTEVRLDPSEFSALSLPHPRLWWPNGYGEPALYALQLSVSTGGLVSDTRRVRFGIRELTYELSLFDHDGRLRRVEFDPAAATSRHEQLIDVRHEAIKRTVNGWAESLSPAGERSAAVKEAASTSLSPYLVIRVNGVPIAARGGSWGMDDSRKRSSRAHLEPFFRLHRNAHLNIIRNWLGQSTEEVFYDLADEYGLLVLNDFWESTQDFQLEAEDPQLFLDNAADVIRRFRNHPSIAVWFGRNEGVPQPILNDGLAALVTRLDGTRYYTGSSNRVNLQDSGPYNWHPPAQYFTTLAGGFSVEVGTPSLGSLETLESYIPLADRWPLGDTYAYHDWHFGGNGDTATFMRALESALGPPTGLEDFERKAQLMNYVAYRAIFEGFQAGLWTRNSGRLLWMTHPAWPSNTWQIYTSDYDAAAAYYGVAKACEPLHAQLDLPDFRPAVVNVSRASAPALTLRSRVIALDGRVLLERAEFVAAPANAVTTLAPLSVPALLAREGIVFVVLTLTDSAGTLLSRNVYWQARADQDERRLSGLPPQSLSLSARSHAEGGDTVIAIDVANQGRTPALLAKLAVLDAQGARVLPAYYSDNYLTLPAGESQSVSVRCPGDVAACATVTVRGWNVAPASVAIAADVAPVDANAR